MAKIDDRINAWSDSLTKVVGRWISARPWYMQLVLYPLSLAVALVSVYAIYGFIAWLAFTALAVPLRPLLTEAYTFLLSGAGHPLAILLVAALVALLLSLVKESPLQIIYGLAQLGIAGIWLFVTLTKFRASPLPAEDVTTVANILSLVNMHEKIAVDPVVMSRILYLLGGVFVLHRGFDNIVKGWKR